MNTTVSKLGRLSWALLALVVSFAIAVGWLWQHEEELMKISNGELVARLFGLPSVMSAIAFLLIGTAAAASTNPSNTAQPDPTSETSPPFMAQVVGARWLNPLMWRDYATEWNLLWTMGMVKANKKDYYANNEPENFSSVKVVSSIAYGSHGIETIEGYHHKYVINMVYVFRDIYFTDPDYFYTVNPHDKTKWREVAGVHVEYAAPSGRISSDEFKSYLTTTIRKAFDIGNPNFPSSWTRDTPPDVHVTQGGPNAGFTSLAAALDYLQAHPKEAVWVMSWDSPSYPSHDPQLDESMTMLVLAGPDAKTEREPLALIGYPASRSTADFSAEKGKPSRIVQAWKATIDAATHNGGKTDVDIGYVIHDANNRSPEASNRIGALAETLSTEIPEFDFAKQTFNTAALLGDMGAGSALTNVALAIAYANHIGKNVLVAGTTNADQPTALVVLPPAKVRPIDPDADWFRARGGNDVYLPWWGLRQDATRHSTQGYSR